MRKTSIGKGRYHLVFNKLNDFIVAFELSYLKEKKIRCFGLYSREDNIFIVQPSVSTQGLNILILKDTEEKEEKIFELFKDKGIPVLSIESIRRPSQSQGFILWFKKAKNFIDALNLFYSKRERCRIIIDSTNKIIIQPSVSTPELNTLIFLEYNGLLLKERKIIDSIIDCFDELIKCDELTLPPKTTNFSY